MIDQQRIHRKILMIENNVSKLKSLREIAPEQFFNDFRNIESSKHLLQVSIECMIDICEHIVAKKRLGTPDSAAECIRIVFNSGFFPKENADTYIIMTKLRNRIVHLYHDMNDMEIYTIIKERLGDFDRFIKDILTGL